MSEILHGRIYRSEQYYHYDNFDNLLLPYLKLGVPSCPNLQYGHQDLLLMLSIPLVIQQVSLITLYSIFYSLFFLSFLLFDFLQDSVEKNPPTNKSLLFFYNPCRISQMFVLLRPSITISMVFEYFYRL
jgi:hypothetical protein